MSPDERSFLRASADALEQVALPLHAGARRSALRLTVIVLAVVCGLFAFGCGLSYFVASRTASKAALRIAPDLGELESDYGLHPESNGSSRLGWEFDYGPSGMGPITLQFYVGTFGQLYRTNPPEAIEQLRPGGSPARQ